MTKKVVTAGIRTSLPMGAGWTLPLGFIETHLVYHVPFWAPQSQDVNELEKNNKKWERLQTTQGNNNRSSYHPLSTHSVRFFKNGK